MQSMVQYACEEKVEKDRHKNTALLHTIRDNERCWSVTTREDETYHAIVKEQNDLNEFLWRADFWEDDLEYVSVDCIKILVKLMKTAWRSICCLQHFYWTCLNEKTILKMLWPGLNLHWDSCMDSSETEQIRQLRNTQARMFPAMESREMQQ